MLFVVFFAHVRTIAHTHTLTLFASGGGRGGGGGGGGGGGQGKEEGRALRAIRCVHASKKE